MLQSRLFEEAITQLWHDGRISGEMHLAIGEEAIAAGIVSQIQEGDALALDHRGTPQLLMRGVDPALLIKELLGYPDGLCRGRGGHMHLFSPPHLAASSGIVGASAPDAVGFALSGRALRPKSIAVAFFGEGAINQGMVMESFNLAAVWKLPVLFVCKDNGWSITTPSDSMTAGRLTERVYAFGINVAEMDGSDVEKVWESAKNIITKMRINPGPAFIRATCVRPTGHFLGDPMLRIAQHPGQQMKIMAGPLVKAATNVRGSSISQRSSSLATVASVLQRAMKMRQFTEHDPIARLRQRLVADEERLTKLETALKQSIKKTVHCHQQLN